MTLYTQVETNTIKTYVLISVFLLFIIGLGWLFSYFLNSSIILVIAVVFSILMSFFSYWYSDKITLSFTGAKLIKKRDNPEVYRLVENLCITAGLPLPKIYIIEDSQPNAFATGRDKNHSVIALTSGLLERLEKPELEGVIAHELCHIGNRDILLSTVVVVLVGVVALISDWFLRITFWTSISGRDGEGDRRTNAIFMVLAIIAAILAPLAAVLIQLAISRKREFLADASSALLTRYPDGLIKALEKISAYPNSMKRASSATAHLYIASPFRGKRAGDWITKLFMTHPPVSDRIKALKGIKI